MKPIYKLGNILSSHKDRIDPFERQGAVYEIPCKNCNLVYVGETKRSFRTRIKEHIRDVRNATTKSIVENSTALCKHAITLDHELDWENSKVLRLLKLTVADVDLLNPFTLIKSETLVNKNFDF